MTERPSARSRLFVVEHYDESGAGSGAASRDEHFPPLPAGLRLACAVRVPGDEVVLALVEGVDQESVCAGVTAAGWRVDRITAASWAGPEAQVTP